MQNQEQQTTLARVVMLMAMVLIVTGLAACVSRIPEDEIFSSSQELQVRYIGRDCMFYHGQLYWNNGVWYSTTEGENQLPAEAYEAGRIVRMVNAVPQSEGEAAILAEGTQYLYHEATDAIFVKQEDGYVQYIPMPGMKEAVEKWQGIEPTGMEPGYDYVGIPLIFYDGTLYDPAFTLYSTDQTGALTQVGRIQCRCDEVPSKHLHSSNLEPGTILYRCVEYPEHLVVVQMGSGTYQLFEVREPIE